ncbi:hypothetical protein [Nitratireductor sp.]|uniref:hypothetical protein n=1 Tax=Nitratireductor sp. TaxID=1872084 RepID=UPI0026177A41|nr:hypothetical protein [Nitratireductor sp.]MCV0381731.1 hypothetical protein [Nitratireductor sp.]
MTDEKIEEVKAAVKTICDYFDPLVLSSVDEIAEIWARLKAQGIYPFDFARICQDFADQLMLTHTELEDCEEFARSSRDSYEKMRKIISEHWPPPDQTLWPYTDRFTKDDDEQT